MTDQFEHQTDDLATALIAGDHPTAERAVDALRELAWHRRADEIRARRHPSPGARRVSLGRAVLRRKPRGHGIAAGRETGLIATGRRGA